MHGRRWRLTVHTILQPFLEDVQVFYLAHEAEERGEHYFSITGDYDSQLEAMASFSFSRSNAEVDSVDGPPLLPPELLSIIALY